jgi:CRP/FNR family transcriptional regulator, anaerobic regulatory protein
MFESTALMSPTANAWQPAYAEAAPRSDFEASLQGIGLPRRLLHRKDYLFRAGQARHGLFLVRSGFFKTAIVSEDGREKITGFHIRGDLIGLDALGSATHGCDAMALDVGEVLELPCVELAAKLPLFQEQLTAALARAIRRDWEWMLATSTLNAEQRVITFLLDLAQRQRALGYSARELVLRMTRAELGNFLALQLETVTRALSGLDAQGLIKVDRREIRIVDADALQVMIGASRSYH